MGRRRGQTELDAQSCRDLLAAGHPGRLGVSTPLGPQVLPVSYAIVDDAVLVGTAPYSLVARRAPGTVVVFQVDHVDEAAGHGWCVQARGRAELIDRSEALDAPALDGHPLHDGPWTARGRRLYLRVRWVELTGEAVRTRPAGPPDALVDSAAQ